MNRHARTPHLYDILVTATAPPCNRHQTAMQPSPNRHRTGIQPPPNCHARTLHFYSILVTATEPPPNRHATATDPPCTNTAFLRRSGDQHRTVTQPPPSRHRTTYFRSILVAAAKPPPSRHSPQLMIPSGSIVYNASLKTHMRAMEIWRVTGSISRCMN